MCSAKRARYLCPVALILCLALRTTPCACADETAPTSKTIVAQAVSAAEKPQAGVALSLFGFNQDWRSWKYLNRDLRTDNQGVAQFDKLLRDTSYLVRATTRDNFVAYRECVLTGDEPQHRADLTLQQPVGTSIRVRNEAGKPIAGAQIWSLKHTGANGTVTFDWQALESLELPAAASNAEGELLLPALPPGTLDLRLIHPDCAPAIVKGIVVGQKPLAEVVLAPGLKLTFRLEMDENEPPVDSIVVDLRRKPFEDPSTSIGRLPGPIVDGRAELGVAPGKFDFLRLIHPDYAVTPIYSEQYGSTLFDETVPFEVKPGQNVFTFRLKRKVKVRGRVVDAEGKPMAGQSIEGTLPAGDVTGQFAPFADWGHIDWADTDANGEYEIHVAAGPARVEFSGQGMVAKPEYHDINVAPDGSTRVPNFVVQPMPKVRGVLFDENCKPLPKAIVRFRGSMLTYGAEPVMTDDQGRFELAPPWVPVDLHTHQRLPAQTVLAFHPTKAYSATAEIRLDEQESLSNVILKLQPDGPEPLTTRFSSDLTPWQRGIVPADRMQSLAAISLAGKPAPELDGSHWLNTPKPQMSLADFRGKYVLLQFWTTWCGPCHADMPSLRILHELYREKGLVIIGVHDNSMPLDAIVADVAKERLKYPIVVDHADGRILARYKAHGVSGYPSYMLIGPDGNVIEDDDTVAGPSLRSFKIEIIRQHLLDGSVPKPGHDN